MKFDQDARTRIVESEAKLSAAQNQAAAIQADARAEEKLSRHLAEQRQFEVDQKRLKVFLSIVFLDAPIHQ